MFYVKMLHLGALAVWLGGLLLLPRLFAAHAASAAGQAHDTYFNLKAQVLYFRVVTPAAVLTVAMGTVLLVAGFDGAWLPLKLVLVAGLVLLHVYLGSLLQHLVHGDSRHPPLVFHLMVWAPLPLAGAIVALAAAKPHSWPWLERLLG